MSTGQFDPRGISRRSFVKASLFPAALSLTEALSGSRAPGGEPASGAAHGPDIIDTNIHLFDWPFRRLKYSRTQTLVAKLRRHRVAQAWAGSFEAVLHKQLDSVNRRLADECQSQGGQVLIPIGSVNPVWPDWEEDLRRCHQQYRMPGLRLYPAYHGYTLDHPDFVRLLGVAAERSMLVQIVVRMEDERVHHAVTDVPEVNAAALRDALQKVPQARVQLINSVASLRGSQVADLVRDTQVSFDISAIEGNGGVGRVILGTHTGYGGPIPVERLLFGSHAPFFPCESALLKLFESPLSLEQLEALMHANARRLLG
jgi:predicted TIM-barrel fold metal-dependent hydrolase